ncbi:MAG: peptidoglycan DD-metalloendopeptidase family protein [Bdellovibrionales bacterium]
MIDFKAFDFFRPIDLPEDYHVFDLSNGPVEAPEAVVYSVGKYNEQRPDMYTSEIYSSGRNIHMGLDIGAPVGTKIKNFYEGEVFSRKYHSDDLDYGYTLVLKYQLGDQALFALFGHLSEKSYLENPIGKTIRKGEEFAYLGAKHENGGWPSHLHLQLSYKAPKNCDMPGVVSSSAREEALRLYPDPQNVFGKLYNNKGEKNENRHTNF